MGESAARAYQPRELAGLAPMASTRGLRGVCGEMANPNKFLCAHLLSHAMRLMKTPSLRRLPELFSMPCSCNARENRSGSELGHAGEGAEGWRAAGCSPSCLIVLAHLKSVKYCLVMGLPHRTDAPRCEHKQTVRRRKQQKSAHAAGRARAAGQPIMPEKSSSH